MIRLKNVSLDRHVQHEHSLDLKRSLFALLKGEYRAPERRSVLRDLTLEIGVGERLGIIGANGAGKSTLLKVIAGILSPTQGSVEVPGVVAPLIELGAGFDPDLSVFDNVVTYGVLLGLSREVMLARMDEILAFAELEAYRTTLVKTLSSGMLARLGFAVATDVEADILLIDEVLSVGDERFRKKSQGRIAAFWERGITSVIVSHDLDFIARACSRVLCIDRGRIAFLGAPKLAVRFYLDVVNAENG